MLRKQDKKGCREGRLALRGVKEQGPFPSETPDPQAEPSQSSPPRCQLSQRESLSPTRLSRIEDSPKQLAQLQRKRVAPPPRSRKMKDDPFMFAAYLSP